MVQQVSTRRLQDCHLFRGPDCRRLYATWCGPCKAISPVLERLSAQYTNAKFIKVDVDEAAEIAQEYGISAMPTFFFSRTEKRLRR